MHLKISYNSTRLRNRDFTATASNKEKIIQTFAVYAKARQDSGLLLLGRPTPPLYIDSTTTHNNQTGPQWPQTIRIETCVTADWINCLAAQLHPTRKYACLPRKQERRKIWENRHVDFYAGALCSNDSPAPYRTKQQNTITLKSSKFR